MIKLMLAVIDSVRYSEEPNHEWINIGYLVSTVKDLKDIEVSVEFFNGDNVDSCIQDIIETVEKGKPDAVGFTVYQYSIEPFKEAVKKLKEQNKDLFVFAGNKEVSVNPIYYLESIPELDAIIIGEGEESLRELMITYENKSSLSECKGIAFRQNDEIIITEAQPLIEDLDSIKFPDKDIYTRPLTVNYIVCSRGCTGHCTFCGYDKKNVRQRSFKNIFSEIDTVLNKYSSKYFHILDGAFGDGSKNITDYYDQFYQNIVNSKLKFCYSFYARSEQINEQSIIPLRKLNSVGLDYIMVGIESGNKEDLKLYGKKATLEENIKAVQLLNESKIGLVAGCIMFNPYSTKERITQNIEFMKDNDILINVSRLSSRLAIYSGAPIVKKITKDKLLLQETNGPIIDGYGYHFVNKEMEDLWRLFEKIDMRVQEKSHMNFYKGMSTSIKMLKYLYDADCTDIEKRLQNYKKLCTDFGYMIFYKALENYDLPNFYKDILPEVDQYIVELIKIEKEIEQMKLLSMYKSFKGNISLKK